MTVENGVAAANRYEYGRGTRQARSDGTWLPLHYVSQGLEKSWLPSNTVRCYAYFSLMLLLAIFLQALASCSFG